MRRAFAAGVLVIVCCSAGAAHAQDNAAQMESAALFQDGRTLLDKGDVAGACELFARSQRRLAAIGTLLNLGACYERLGRVASAWAAYREAASLALTRKDDRGSVATKEAARLEPRVPKLTIVIEGKASVTRNNEAVDAAVLNHPTPVDPGLQTIKVSAPDHEPWEGSVTVTEGAQETITVPKLVPVPRKIEPPPPPRERATPWAPIGVGVGGGVLAVGGLVLGGLSFSKWSDVEARCPNGTCPNLAARQAASGDADSASTFATISTVGVISGLAIAALAVVYYFATRE